LRGADSVTRDFPSHVTRKPCILNFILPSAISRPQARHLNFAGTLKTKTITEPRSHGEKQDHEL